MILPIPAIDIINGQCVRLEKGDYSRMSIYSDSPLKMALYWEEKKAPMLHLIDLDGAKTGKPVNFSILTKIINSIHIPVEICLLYTSPSPRDRTRSRMPSSA